MDFTEKFMLSLLLFFILFSISFPFLGSYFTCRSKAIMQEMEWSYGPIQGCMVKQKNGKWIDYDRLRYMED